eukprot:TRINITY_DN46498_c0_g1_i1.p1 TRINITY_DN46498_c0_g1~~TRINITY_DN46498_c0_g1_i1.p1  ORF type:complete len:883 (+),score=85.22 TRINITY_DN46498_c0_g1_i1:102-2750(+)
MISSTFRLYLLCCVLGASAQTENPTVWPTRQPTISPTLNPTPPTREPTQKPTNLPSHAPTATPTSTPTAAPTATPTAAPTLWPTPLPTLKPTPSPTPTDYTPAPTRGDCLATAWRGIYTCPANTLIREDAVDVLAQDNVTCCRPACSGYLCPLWMGYVRNAQLVLGNDTDTCCLPLPTHSPTPMPSVEPTPLPPTPPTSSPTQTPTPLRCISFQCPLKYLLKADAGKIYGSDWNTCCEASCALFDCPDFTEHKSDAASYVGKSWTDCCDPATAMPSAMPTRVPTTRPSLQPTRMPTQYPTLEDITGSTITFTATLQGLDYTSLSNAEGMLGKVRDSLEMFIADEARVPVKYVEVMLSAGSLAVSATISTPLGSTSGFILEQLGTPAELSAVVVAGALAVAGIKTVSTSTISAVAQKPQSDGMELISRGLCRDMSGRAQPDVWSTSDECTSFADCQQECMMRGMSLCQGVSFLPYEFLQRNGHSSCYNKGVTAGDTTMGICSIHTGMDLVSAKQTRDTRSHQDHKCYVIPGSDAAKIPTPLPTAIPTPAPTTAQPTASPTRMAIVVTTNDDADDGSTTTLVIVAIVAFVIAVFVGVIVAYICCCRRKRSAKVSPACEQENLVDAACLSLPRYWKNRNPYAMFNTREEPHLDVMKKLCEMAVPGSELITIQRVEDSKLWQKYAKYRHTVKEQRRSMCTSVKQVCDCELSARLTGTSADPFLDWSVNEVYLFHGADADKVTKIGTKGLGVLFDEEAEIKEGEAAEEPQGPPYGAGLYMSDVGLKADTHSKEVDGGANRGIVCLMLCRVVLGEIKRLPDDEKSRPEARQKRATKRAQAVAESGSHDSVVGTQTGEREFVLFDENAVYPEYLFFYKRPWWEGWDEWR